MTVIILVVDFLLPTIPMIAAFASYVVLIVLLVRKGDEGSNKYGPDSRTISQ